MDELPPRSDLAHKGDCGTVAVIGGSEHLLGAPCFAATAALRAGAGIVLLAVPEPLTLPALTLAPSAMASPIGKDIGAWLARLPTQAVLAVGCGWGRDDDRLALLRALLAAPHPLVLDADGLHALPAVSGLALPRAAPWILTPNPGEYQRLASAWGLAHAVRTDEQRTTAAIALAKRTGAIVVLKGADTVISDGATTSVAATRNAALAIPGSGDVLTGLIASLLAQGSRPLVAARLGVHLHGVAAGIWRERSGSRGMLALELAGLIPEALMQHERQQPQ